MALIDHIVSHMKWLCSTCVLLTDPRYPITGPAVDQDSFSDEDDDDDDDDEVENNHRHAGNSHQPDEADLVSCNTMLFKYSPEDCP